MTIIRGHGWLPDAPDARDFDAHLLPGLVGSFGELSDSVDHSGHVDQVLDQGQTNSCAAFATINAMRVRASLLGRPLPMLSVLDLYFKARFLEVGSKDTPDRGSFPRLVMRALTELGVVGNDRWPFFPERVNQAPPWDVLQHSVDARSAAYYRVNGVGEERCAMLRRALASGFVPCFGTVVDDQVREGPLETIGRAVGHVDGRHMQCITGFGVGYFVVLGLYGSDHYGFGGFTRMSDERIGSVDCADFWVITDAPGPTEVT